MRLTPSQNIILYEIAPAQQAGIQAILTRCGIKREDEIDPLERYAMACPALPTCGLATTESERAMPGILERIRAVLVKVGLPQEHFITRMTGCPNGCARPYLAELGFVGNGPGLYQVWLGAAPNQTRLAKPYLEKMHVDDLETTLEPIFVYFRQWRQADESFGDFCDRVGLDAIHQYVASYEPGSVASPQDSFTQNGKSVTLPTKTTKVRRRVTVQEATYSRLQAAATELGKPMSHLANEAIEAYLERIKDEG
jgi:sulfite reductase (ferredoxin)